MPSGSVSTTSAPSWSWPSRKTVAVTGKGSPTVAFAGQRPRSTSGRDVHDGDASDHAATLADDRNGIQPAEATGAGSLDAACGSASALGPSHDQVVHLDGRMGPLRRPAPPGLERSKQRCYRPPVRAIRRFTVRPVLPEALAALGKLAGNLRWSWHPETQDLFEARRPGRCGTPSATTRSGCSAPSGRARLDELAADQEFLARRSSGRGADLDAYLTEDRWYQREAATDAPALDRLLLPRVRHHRRAARSTPAASASSPATTSRPPATSACRSSASACSTGTATSSSRCPREGWQQETYPVLDPDGLPLTLLREDGRLAGARSSITLPGGRRPGRAASGSPRSAGSRCCCSTPTSRRTRGHFREVTDRLYGGTSEHRLRQEMLLGVGGVRALRVYSRITGAPEPEVFHTNEGHAGFLGLERIRELTVAEGGPGLDFDTALEVSRAGTVFTTHTPVPGRHRPVRPRPGRAVLRRRQRRCPASRSTGSSRSAPRTTTAATPTSSTWR